MLELQSISTRKSLKIRFLSVFMLILVLKATTQYQSKSCVFFNLPFCSYTSQLEQLVYNTEPQIKSFTIKFTLYNKTYFSGVTLVHYDSLKGIKTLRDIYEPVKMDANVETKILVEGFNSFSKGPMSETVIEAYLKSSNSNVIVADWNEISGNYYIQYPTIAKNIAPKVGGAIAVFIVSHLMQEQNIRLGTVTLIGFSLGAHIAGFAGKAIQKLLNRKLPVIVGLDPAQPAFRTKGKYDRLDADDADYVEVIHTAAVVIAIYNPIGTVDFYPNYSKRIYYQPGCVKDWNWKCSHFRAFELFAESIKVGHKFVAYKCKDLEGLNKNQCLKLDEVSMGGESLLSKDAKGIYYVKTCDRPPFSNCSLP